MGINISHEVPESNKIMGTPSKKIWSGEESVVVKVQLPLFEHNTDEALAFVYPKKRDWEGYISIDKKLIELMGSAIKKYFVVSFDKEHHLVFEKEVPTQEW